DHDLGSWPRADRRGSGGTAPVHGDGSRRPGRRPRALYGNGGASRAAPRRRHGVRPPPPRRYGLPGGGRDLCAARAGRHGPGAPGREDDGDGKAEWGAGSGTRRGDADARCAAGATGPRSPFPLVPICLPEAGTLSLLGAGQTRGSDPDRDLRRAGAGADYRTVSGAGWRTLPSGVLIATSSESRSHITIVTRSVAAANVRRSMVERPRSLRGCPAESAR